MWKYIYGPPLIILVFSINGWICKGIASTGIATNFWLFGNFVGLMSDLFLLPLNLILRLFGYQLEFIVF